MANEEKDKDIENNPLLPSMTPWASSIVRNPLLDLIPQGSSQNQLSDYWVSKAVTKAAHLKSGQCFLALTISGSLDGLITPSFLANVIAPYINAIANLQYAIDEIKGRTPEEIIVREITQRSPISLNLNGGAEAIEVIKETVVPWRKKHAEKMARFQEREKQVEIETKKAEILEKRARAAKDKAEAEKIAAEAYHLRQEGEKVRLENEKLRIELYNAQIELALNALSLIAPNLAETEKIAYVVKLLQPLGVLASSELEPFIAQIGTSSPSIRGGVTTKS